jgi:hypothetical protein
MRTATNIENPKYQLNITEFVITKNMWEFYLTDDVDKDNPDIVRAYVLGFENELGDISKSEIMPFAITHTNNLHEVMPPVGFTWDDAD